MLIKGYDTDVKEKALIFEEAQIKMFMLGTMETSYWLVRQAMSIVAFFGGLRLQECLDLQLEKMVRTKDGYKITHSRVKQRSDKRESVFLVPAQGGFADQLGVYVEKVKSELNIFTGRVWWTGVNGNSLKKQPMGKNMVGKVPHDLAIRLKLSNPEKYTFHSYRRTSASFAAHGGMTSEQMQSFYGWKHPSMCQEYISTSRPAILHMASTLASTDFNMAEPEVEVDVEVEVSEEEAVLVAATQEAEEEALLMAASQAAEQEEEAFLEAMLMAATQEAEQKEAVKAADHPATTATTITRSITTALAAVPALQGVSVEVLVVHSNTGNITM